MFPGCSNSDPVGEFEADTVEEPILANETIGLDDPASVTWRSPIGWTSSERLEEIIIYSEEGHAIKFGVDATRLPQGGRGLAIVSQSNHNIPEGVDHILPLQFMDPMFLALSGETLYELDQTDMEPMAEIALDFSPQWHSNLWNRWSLVNTQGELLFVMAGEDTVALYAKIPPNPAYGEIRERRFYEYVSLDDYDDTSGSKVIGEPIVLNVPLEDNGSLIVVPTDHGIAALDLEYNVSGSRVVDVKIGEVVWFISFDDMSNDLGLEVEPTRDRPISIAYEAPYEARGKDRIFLMTNNGHIHSFHRANGTLDWSLDLMGDIDGESEMVGMWPDARGNLIITATVDDDGLVAAIDPDHGVIMGNGSYYHIVPTAVTVRPEYVLSIHSYIFNSEDGTVYILSDRFKLRARFEVPGGLATDLGYVGNIVNNIGSTHGNYYAAITGNTTLWVQSMSGRYTPPQLPEPDGKRVLIVTDMGNITIGLFVNETPRTASYFLDLVENGTFNDVPIGSIVPSVAIITGYSGDPASDIPNEGAALALGHHFGAVSMIAHEPGRTGPEFLMVNAEWGYHAADGMYAVFGVVVEGMDVVQAINEVPVDDELRPIDEVRIKEVILKEAPGPNGNGQSDNGWTMPLGPLIFFIVIIIIIFAMVAEILRVGKKD
jgi:cyclophilin family peptidyl-prolyl cis-trans isomerase/outer membrane protein assembly factor BamB